MKKYQFLTINPRANGVGDSTDQIIDEKTLKEYLRAFPVDNTSSFDDWLIVRYEGLVYLWRPVKSS
jgi:hypothetical protein